MKLLKLIMIFAIINILTPSTVLAQPKQFKALLITTTNGWHHESVHYGVVALKELAIKNYFDLVLIKNPNGFTDQDLKQYQVVIF